MSEIDVPGRKFVREYTVAPAGGGDRGEPGRRAGLGRQQQSNTVTILDPKAGAIAGTIAGFGMAYRLAVTPDNRTVVITDPPNAVVRIIDRATRKDRATVKIPAEGVTDKAEFPGSPSPEGIILSRDGRTAFVALQGNSRVAIIDIGTGTILGYVPTGAGPDGIGYSPFGR